MRLISAGLVAGIAVFLGAAAIAEAQPINTPTGPTKVYVTDTSSTYTSTITSSGPTYIQLRVVYQGVIKHTSTTYVSSYGTVNFSKLVTNMNLFGMQVGQALNYKTLLWLASNPAYRDLDDWWVPIEQGTTFERKNPFRADPRELQRFRREELWA